MKNLIVKLILFALFGSQLTGTVSHVLGKATFDSSYQEEREQMLESCQTTGDHLKAGLMGLSSGVFGGMTSIVTQPIKDARSYGVGVSQTSGESKPLFKAFWLFGYC